MEIVDGRWTEERKVIIDLDSGTGVYVKLCGEEISLPDYIEILVCDVLRKRGTKEG